VSSSLERHMPRLWIISALMLAAPGLLSADPEEHPPSELIGLWRGTSVCTDKVAAPACTDEVVVYEFTAGDAGKVHWKADKVVDGERQTMGELDLDWDEGDACWKGELQGPRVPTVWCLTVKEAELTGSGWLLPGKQTVRKIEARRDFGDPARRKR
jgi:hypothetical protein